jgi:hypothetical protein
MYFPYLRGKQFELEALLEVSPAVYSNTIPIIEPVSIPRLKLYDRFATQNIPVILIINPYHPQDKRLSSADVQKKIVDKDFATHPNLVLGFIVDTRYTIADLNSFLRSNPKLRKALIFRYNPLPTDLPVIQSSISSHPVEYIIFEDRKTNNSTRNAFNAHPHRVLITDGFQHQDRNADYPASSAFESNFNTWRTDGWFGIGDYLTIGDHFSATGGQVYVISLHITTQSPSGLLANHFSSTIHARVQGLSAPKFTQANGLLVASSAIAPLTSSGLSLYRDWHRRNHNPHLGAAKKASIMHHIELMSSII